MRWNLLNIKLTILKWTIQWHLVHSQGCASAASIQSPNISSAQKKPHDHPNKHRKSTWQNPTSFQDKKTLNKLGVEGNFLNLIKGIYEKPTANLILNSERMKAFPLRSRKGCLLMPLQFNIVLEALAREIKQKWRYEG